MIEFRNTTLRSTTGDGRTFDALAVSYGTIDDYQTRWIEGCFSEELAKRLPVIAWSHDWTDPIGRAIAWRDTPQGPIITARLSDPDAVPRARQAAAQLADGTITDVSVGFNALEDRIADDGIREIVRAEMSELSLVIEGAVPGAEVLAIRQRERESFRRQVGDVELEALEVYALAVARGDVDRYSLERMRRRAGLS